MRKDQELTPTDRQILGFVNEQGAALSLQVARETKLWFTDVDDSLGRLVDQGLVEKHEMQSGLSRYFFVSTEQGVAFIKEGLTDFK